MIPPRLSLKPKVRLFFSLMCMGITGCSTGTLRDVTSETSSTSTDILYEEALSNIAMTRFYGGKVLPSSYEIVGGNVAVNDQIGIMGGGSYASITHLFTPSITVPAQRAFQKTWNITTQDDINCLHELQAIYHQYACDKPYSDHFKSSVIIPPRSIAGKYRGVTVWVDADDEDGMNYLYDLVGKVLTTIQAADDVVAHRRSPPKANPSAPATQFVQ